MEASEPSELSEDVLEVYNYPAWRWLVLFAFSYMSAMNAFMFMNFTTVPALSARIFAFDEKNGTVLPLDEEQNNWLYSASLVGGPSRLTRQSGALALRVPLMPFAVPG
jgi:hypothetical protein